MIKLFKAMGLPILRSYLAWVLGCISVVVSLSFHIAAQTPTPTPQPDDDVIEIETELIDIPVTVADRNGKYVIGLKKENFIVLEDGKSQEISEFSSTNVPFEIVLLLDTSGSARDDLELIRRSARVFIDSLRPGDRLGIAAYNSEVSGTQRVAVTEILAPLSADKTRLRAALDKISTSNATPFYDSLISVTQKMFPDDEKGNAVKRRALVMLTDGVDSSSTATFSTARNLVLDRGIAGFVVRVDTRPFFEQELLGDCSTSMRFSPSQIKRYYDSLSKSPRLERVTDICKMGDFERLDISKRLYEIADAEMEHLAQISGGAVFKAESLADARDAFNSVADTIGKIYSIGYYSTNDTKDGKFRRITVRLKGVEGDFVIRSREGYAAKPN